MRPKEKAEKLLNDMYFSNSTMSIFEAKQCALIAVDEILEEALGLDDNDYQSKYDYWLEVKQELEKL